ncbi:MAG: exopolyphosphatase [Bacteroidetes bacterium]|nr:exopolyphosphatase [Bacteroidota bacterium]
MKLGAIDIGSNAVRLLLMYVHETPEGSEFIKNTIYRVPLRLGEEAFLKGKISENKAADLIKTIKAFKNILEVTGTDIYRACATSAMRESSNSEKIIARVKDKTGVKIEVISGNEESEIIFGNHIEIMYSNGNSNYLYIDVGGGSTELVLMSEGTMIDKHSFDIGTLRLKHDMVTQSAWNEMRSWLYRFRNQYKHVKGIGSGGNINHILKHYSKSKSDRLSLDIIETSYRLMKAIPDIDKQIKLGMRPDRADVIVPALEIFRKIMNWVDIDEVYVPKHGLPEGIIRQLYEKNKGKEKK